MTIKDTKAVNKALNLPQMKLSIFTGSYEEWKSVYDSFISLIDNENNLTLIQKLHTVITR